MDKPQTKVRVNITLAPNVFKKLEELCLIKGLNRPAVVSLAIDKLWKEELGDG